MMRKINRNIDIFWTTTTEHRQTRFLLPLAGLAVCVVWHTRQPTSTLANRQAPHQLQLTREHRQEFVAVFRGTTHWLCWVFFILGRKVFSHTPPRSPIEVRRRAASARQS